VEQESVVQAANAVRANVDNSKTITKCNKI